MDKEDALIVFEDHIRQLEKEDAEEKQREKGTCRVNQRHFNRRYSRLVRVYRQQRKTRESFVHFLDQLHAQGKLTSISKWKNLYGEISADPRYTAMLNQPLSGECCRSYRCDSWCDVLVSGSNPLDLFKFYVEELKARYEDEKQIIKDILRKKEFDVTSDTTYEAFADVISEDDRSEKLDAGNVKRVYERLLEKVQERDKERLREETKKRKRLETQFLKMLHDVEPAIDEKSEWDQVRPLVANNEAFHVSSKLWLRRFITLFLSQNIETEMERITLFHQYQETLQEQCTHHHSRSKKKSSRDKRSKDRKAKRRSPSSSSDDRRDSQSSSSVSRSRSRSRSRDSSGYSRSRSLSSERDRRRRSPVTNTQRLMQS